MITYEIRNDYLYASSAHCPPFVARMRFVAPDAERMFPAVLANLIEHAAESVRAEIEYQERERAREYAE